MAKSHRTEEEKTTRDGSYNPITVKKLEIYLKKLENGNKDKRTSRRNSSNR